MTAEEKAKELVSKYLDYVDNCSITDNFQDENAKQCALIAVDEILLAIDIKTLKGKKHPIYEFYEQVKNEIEKL